MKKLSNKILIITLLVLVAIFVLSRIFRSPALESNLRKELVVLDTARVTTIKITLASDSAHDISLHREGNGWEVLRDQKKASADKGSVASMLGVLKSLQPQRMVSRKKEKWDTYHVGNSSTRIVVIADGSEEADIRIGKTGFAPGQPSPYGQGGGSAYTYVRLTDEPEVYVIDGFLASHFNRSYDDWRDKAFMRIRKDDVVKVAFNYPDSGFVLQKHDSIWQVGGHTVANQDVTSYLNKLQYKNMSAFDDTFNAPGPAQLVVQIEGTGGALGVMQAWQAADHWVLGSSLQKGVFFKQEGALPDIFARRSAFVK